MRIKVGIFFGGPSRERELSFTSGRAIFDTLDRQLFEPIPIFVDSGRKFILLNWKHLYESGIRDFLPSEAFRSTDDLSFPVYQESLPELSPREYDQMLEAIGRKVELEELPQLISLAFLALYGEFGEDGQIQQLLTDLRIPFTGSGMEASRLGNDKARQKEILDREGLQQPAFLRISREQWLGGQPGAFFERASRQIGFPMVVRPVDQGSSIGVSLIEEDAGLDAFIESVNGAFFREVIPVRSWQETSAYDKADHLRLLTDLRDGLGFPVDVLFAGERTTFYRPQALLAFLNEKSWSNEDPLTDFVLESNYGSAAVILEAFVEGREFTCSVVRQEDGSTLALPLTEIHKSKGRLDFLPKFIPDSAHQTTPMELPPTAAAAIRQACERIFTSMGFQGFARIDGFLTKDGETVISDVDTMPSFWPGSSFFLQAATIGLGPTQFLTFLIRASLQERVAEQPQEASFRALLRHLDDQNESQHHREGRPRIAIILGGLNLERNVSVATGRNVWEKLTAAGDYLAAPVFLAGHNGEFKLFQLPPALALKGDADSIRKALTSPLPSRSLSADLWRATEAIRKKYGAPGEVIEPVPLRIQDLAGWADAVFIALHGRPGEDGQLQEALDQLAIPYNGADAQASAIAIDKSRTREILHKNGFSVPFQVYGVKTDYEADPEAFLRKVEKQLVYPLVAKPVDEGSSQAVRIIQNRRELDAYIKLLFRNLGHEALECRYTLKIRPQEEFPRKEEILFEEMILANGASRLLEVTAGVLTHRSDDGGLRYEVLPPTEMKAQNEVLTSEEKFFQAGDGQRTPARFADEAAANREVTQQVTAEMERAARVLNLHNYARIDAFVRVFEDNSAETIILEANTLPALTPATPLFSAAALAGYTPHEFIGNIVDYSLAGSSQPAVTKPAIMAPPSAEATPAGEEPLPYEEIFSEEKEEQPVYFPTPSPKKQPLVIEKLKGLGKAIWAFLSSPYFLKNFGALLGFLLIFYLLLNVVLRLYTHHGESLQVQNYIGMNLDEAQRTARRRSFKLVVIDSVFLVDREPNRILEQDPKPFSRVKENRRIYITITSQTPPLITLPEMTGSYNYDQYSRKLIRLGMKPYIKAREFDNKLEENTILYFEYDGRKITDAELHNGVKAPKGSELAFVVTERLTNYVDVPDLRCKTFEAAAFQLSANNLSVGDIRGNVSDRDQAFVYDQEPAPGGKIRMGEQITVYLSTQRPTGCPEEVELPEFEEEPRDTIFE